MKFEILNRVSGATQFTAEINCATDTLPRLKLGLAVCAAIKDGADLSGANLSVADLRDADLRVADLSGADLSGADLRDANLSGANLRDADLRDANLVGANLRGANLSGANLSGAGLIGADLSGVPVIGNIHQKVFAAASADGALDMSNWHGSDQYCGTTHCRAGLVVALAGQEGAVLEERLGTSCAATLIYLASDSGLDKIPDFHCSNSAALADMKRMAENELAGVQ